MTLQFQMYPKLKQKLSTTAHMWQNSFFYHINSSVYSMKSGSSLLRDSLSNFSLEWSDTSSAVLDFHYRISILSASESELIDESPWCPCVTRTSYWSRTGCLNLFSSWTNSWQTGGAIDPSFLFKANYLLHRQFLLSMFCSSSLLITLRATS